MEKIALYFFLWIVGACSAANPLARIIEGVSTDIKDYPYQVSLRTTGNGESQPSHFCGGTIIDKNYIVSAAHCFVMYDYGVGLVHKKVEDFKVYAGTSTLDNRGSVYDIASYTNHPQYNISTFHNDIAIVKLSKPIEFSDTQKAVELPSSPIKNGMKGIVTGWGDTHSSYGRVPPKVLQKTTMIIIDSEKCLEMARILNANPRIYEEDICAYNPDKKGRKHYRYPGPCIGDSGGPLVADNKLVGVVSHGFTRHCGDGDPDIFANVYFLLDFIKENTAN